MIKDLKTKRTFTVKSVTHLTDFTYVLRFSRENVEFSAGQYLTVGRGEDLDCREYSVFSSPNSDYLEVLVREVEEGLVSRRLKKVKPGASLKVNGPYGYFTISENQSKEGKFLFIATGTGISPFHSFVNTYPDLDYKLLHGVRTLEECYVKEVFGDKYTSCVSREEGGDFSGRVTDYLKNYDLDPDTYCFICGNCDMIYEVFDILRDKGVSPDQLHAEVYF